MHDIDRTQAEFATEAEDFETESLDTEYAGEAEDEGPLEETEEMELAGELLEVSSEAELDQFLSKLIRNASSHVRGFLKSPGGRTLGGLLKGALKKALPVAGGALGGLIGGPVGAPLGASLASQAGSMFGLELEGLSGEDQEYEIARQFIRFAADAAQKAATAAAGGAAPPQQAAVSAAIAAARKYAPGLLQEAAPALPQAGRAYTGGGPARSGRWIRRGRRILLLGV